MCYINICTAIPGDGNAPLTLTLADDIGKAVTELVDAQKWEKHTSISGENTSWNNILHTVEKVTGTFLVALKLKAEE